MADDYYYESDGSGSSTAGDFITSGGEEVPSWMNTTTSGEPPASWSDTSQTTTQTFDDGSTLIFDSAGNIIGATPATDSINNTGQAIEAAAGALSSGTSGTSGTSGAAGIKSATDLLKKLFTTTDSKGNTSLNTGMLGLLGGGVGALLGANQSNATPTGYQGKIPKLVATRQAPGPGQRLSGNVLFTDASGTVTNPNSAAPSTAAAAPPAQSMSAPYAATGGISGLLPNDGHAPSTGGQVLDKNAAPAYLTDPEYLRLAAARGDSMSMDYRPEDRAMDAYIQAQNPTYNQDREAAMALAAKAAAQAAPVQAAKGGTLQSGGFVIPADVVSHFGNGSSDAGLKLLATKLGATPIKGRGDGMSDSIPTSIDGKQKALVAHEEAYMSPEKVARLGGGDASKGAKQLRDMMNRIRKARTGSKEQGKQIDPGKFMPGGEVKRYAGGTEVTGSAINAGVTGSESNLSNWAGDYVTNMLGKGQALSEMPFEQYSGPLTAGASPLQTQAFNTAGTMGVPSGIGQAADTAGGIATKAQGVSYSPVGSDFGTAQAQQYMNPYLKAALDPQLAELQRQNTIANMGNAAQLTKAGAYGGSRQAVMNAENQRNMLDKTNQLVSQGYNTAYDKAMAQFNADQARKTQEAQYGADFGLKGLQTGLQAAQTQGQLGTAQNQAEINNLKSLAEMGAIQRGLESEDIAAQKAQFEEARVNPYKMVQFQQSLLQGLPLAAQSYNITQPSTLQQILSGVGGGAKLGGFTQDDLNTALKNLGII